MKNILIMFALASSLAFAQEKKEDHKPLPAPKEAKAAKKIKKEKKKLVAPKEVKKI